ncbi:leishmanolysin family protein, putative [Ichthyophthirius multifiliis]|uniref:Leishmanolysin family protein, putative n=1 Tax=Ichthyophthirius multifiliis TaxID=5932 RepID=G0QR17_ICHMU|nr:leishmanolysin family protein, putative [Ichthyophthirius multifiliis]EGR32339.1 leishmanolysin family protein, putative [Ichthyophthirius multifiliis]|eukprot:XP_004035825.1 leishmanolysin family protein, putative [Ichthyophthirius multifiliis]
MESILSIFTIAVLKDTGYYAEVNESMANNIQWGKNKGCDFVLKACQSGTYYSEFSRTEYCRGQCSSQNYGYGEVVQNSLMDNCKKINNSVLCEDYSNLKQFHDNLLQYYGVNSRCFRSTANDGLYNKFHQTTRCHHVICSPDFTYITIGFPDQRFQKLVCTQQDQGKQMEVVKEKPEYGFIECSDNQREFCSYTPECPYYCNLKGICIHGEYKFSHGWSGTYCQVQLKRFCAQFILDDDSQKCVQQCPQGKFANPDKFCREQCPNGYYQDNINNIYQM